MSGTIAAVFLAAAAVSWTANSAFATAATGSVEHAFYVLFGWLPWQMLGLSGLDHCCPRVCPGLSQRWSGPGWRTSTAAS